MSDTKNPYIESAYEQLQVISQDKEKRWEYEAREKAVRDHNQLIFEAEQRGKTEIILAMYQSGMSTNQISSIVKIDLEEVEKMIRSKNSGKMREEYDIKNLNPRKNPYVKKMKK